METAVILFIILGIMSGLSHGVGVLPDTLHASAGGNVTFNTTVTPSQKPFLIVAWSFTDIHGTLHNIITSSGVDIIEPGYKSRITLFRSTGSLELRSLSLSDSGEYSVAIIPDGAAQIKGNCRLVVHVPVSNIVVTPSSTDLVEFISSVTLSCSTSGSSPSFLWLNGSSEITASERVQITNGGSTLTILNVNRYDQGPFRCHVSNVVSNGTSDPVKLSISFGPENTFLEVSPSQEYYDEGSDISLSCTAVSNPPAHFEWFMNKTLLSDTGPELRLENIKMNQSGYYSCQAYNSKTTKYQTSFPWVVTVLQATISNVVVTPSSTDLVESTSSVRLSCSSSGSSPSIRWLNGSSEVTASERVQITDGNSTLTIANVTRYDQGPFRCHVFNPVSNATSDPVVLSISSVSRPPAMFQWVLNGALLTDTGPELRLNNIQMSQSGDYSCLAFNNKTTRSQTSPSAVITVLEPISNVVVTPSSTDVVEFNSSVTLSCSSSGSSPSFLWLNGSAEVTASERVQITDGNSTLTIVSVTRYDQGPFRCNASNAVSNGLSRPVNLVIQYGPEMVTIIGPDSAHAGDFTMLYCSATSVPSAAFTWLFKGSPTNVHAPVYIIQSSSSSDHGRYTCTALNTVTGHSETVHHELSVTDLLAGNCSVVALKVMLVTAGCCLGIALVCALIVCGLIRGKRAKSKYPAHHFEKQSVKKRDSGMYKTTGTAQLPTLSLEPDPAFTSTAL